MFELKSFEGSPEELSEFVVATWNRAYRGKMPVPQWSADYFRWQLRLDEPDSRRRLVAAYDGDRLAGVVLHFPMTFEMKGERFEAAQASWLSVSSDYQGQGVAKKLQQHSSAVLRADGRRFQLGYGYFGSRFSLGLKFWRKMEGTTTSFVKPVGLWARVLDPRRAAAWNLHRWESWLTRLAAPLIPPPPRRHPSGVVIRPIESTDVDRCVELADRATQHCDLRLIWDGKRLARQLGITGYGQALVAVERGKIQGCIGFHVLPILGRTVEPVGVIDLIFVSELSAAARRELLNSVLVQLRDAGAIVALKLRSGDCPARTFLDWGWVWKPADSHVMITWAEKPAPLPPLHRLHLLWR